MVNNERYGKPNMAALKGEFGKRVFDIIKNTPATNYAEYLCWY